MVYGLQDAFEEIAKDREITSEPRRVLDYMFSKLDFENFIQLSQRTSQKRSECTRAKYQKQ